MEALELKIENKTFKFEAPEELLRAVERDIEHTDVVLDIGSGISPMNFFRPKLHFMVEPWPEYADILSYRFADDKSVFVIRTGALEALRSMSNASVDSVFLLDVIEHMTKEDGFSVLKEVRRVARNQVIVFTPLGFMPQHVEAGQPDGWGLSGNDVQEHLSGWEPTEFGTDWSFYVCEEFHKVDFNSKELKNAYGAFFAILNLEATRVDVPKKFPTVQVLLPSEREANELKVQNEQLRAQLLDIFSNLEKSRSLRLIRRIKSVLALIGVKC